MGVYVLPKKMSIPLGDRVPHLTHGT